MDSEGLTECITGLSILIRTFCHIRALCGINGCRVMAVLVKKCQKGPNEGVDFQTEVQLQSFFARFELIASFVV